MRSFVFGFLCAPFYLSSCSALEAVTEGDGGAGILRAGAEAVKDAAPANPLDLTGWLVAGGGGLVAIIAEVSRRYLKKKKEQREKP